VLKADKIWMDGEIVDWDKAQVHILTHTLHYGLGVFEGIRCYECEDGSSAIFRLKDHIKRLYNSADILSMKIPFEGKTLFEACKEIMRINKLKHGYIRPLAFIGDGEMGLYALNNPIRVAIAAWPWGTYLGDEGVKNGIRAKVSSYTRHQEKVILSKSKAVSSYTNSILAKREVLSAGYEEAIMLDPKGHILEATGENVFMVSDGVVKTAPLDVSVLEGITRDSIITILKDEGIPVKEELFRLEDVYAADELFLTGTAAEVTPVREVDDRAIGTGKPGPITQKVQKIYFNTIKGKNKKYSKWLDVL
jgi:branched-chain amino acid aminotransferase